MQDRLSRVNGWWVVKNTMDDDFKGQIAQKIYEVTV